MTPTLREAVEKLRDVVLAIVERTASDSDEEITVAEAARLIRKAFTDALAHPDAPEPSKCDGNHGGPRCADPECWNDEPDAPEPKPMWAGGDPKCECCQNETHAAWHRYARRPLNPIALLQVMERVLGADHSLVRNVRAWTGLHTPLADIPDVVSPDAPEPGKTLLCVHGVLFTDPCSWCDLQADGGLPESRPPASRREETPKTSNGMELRERARALVASSPLHKRFIAHTPLENDIAVWIEDFASAVLEGRTSMFEPKGEA